MWISLTKMMMKAIILALIQFGYREDQSKDVNSNVLTNTAKEFMLGGNGVRFGSLHMFNDP